RPAMFWSPAYLEDSAEIYYAPLIFWLMDVLRPNVVVEVGAYSGATYFAYCQSVDKLSLSTRCYAVYEADEQTIDSETYNAIELYNRDKYGTFSTIIKKT